MEYELHPWYAIFMQLAQQPNNHPFICISYKQRNANAKYLEIKHKTVVKFLMERHVWKSG